MSALPFDLPPVIPEPGTYNGTLAISNSEIGEWQKCQLAWLYKYHPEARITPKRGGPARTRGIFLHLCLEDFYANLKAGKSARESADVAIERVVNARHDALAHSDGDMMEMFRKCQSMLERYFEKYEKDIEYWEILSTENFHMMEAEPGDRFYIAMRLDMVIYQHSGAFAGEISPVDHKSTNDWWRQSKFVLNSQMPSYIRALRQRRWLGHEGAPIKRAIMNFIRTRDMKDPAPHELLMRHFEPPLLSAREDNVYQNFLKIARQIEPLRRMEFKDARNVVAMSLGLACDFCDFNNVCMVTIDNGDPRPVIAAEYTKSTYGYPDLETIDDGIG